MIYQGRLEAHNDDVLSYFSDQKKLVDKAKANVNVSKNYREPSYGTFVTSVRVNYFFGTPQSVEMTGVLMDMDRMKSSAECNINCYDKYSWTEYLHSRRLPLG